MNVSFYLKASMEMRGTELASVLVGLQPLIFTHYDKQEFLKYILLSGNLLQ